MDTEDKRMLQVNFTTLIDDLDVAEILPHTYELGIFTRPIIETIKSERTRCDQATSLIMKLQQRGPEAFGKFYECLVRVCRDDLAKLLKPSLDPEEFRQERGLGRRTGNGQRQPKWPVPESGTCGIAASKELPEPIAETSAIIDIEVKKAEKLIPPADGVDGVYSMVGSPRGLALILNNRKFTTPKLQERIGTDVDALNMKVLLQQLDYLVTEKNNCTAQQMRRELESFSRRADHRESVVVVILSHGRNGAVFGTDGESVGVDDITTMFDGQHGAGGLVGRPKIFIVQACRGATKDPGVERVDGAGGDDVTTPRHDVTDAQVFVERTRVARGSDMHFAFATIPGHVSWRNEERGSWFIQAVVEVFQEWAHQDELQHLFIKVNKYLSERFKSEREACVQISSIEYRLTKKFYFNPGLTAS